MNDPVRMSGNLDVARLNQALKGKTDLLAFELVRMGSKYELKLTLGQNALAEAELVCHDVQNLELNPTGDGFDQMLQLRVSDLREDGLDRIHFSVEEEARETLFLHCADLKLTLLP